MKLFTLFLYLTLVFYGCKQGNSNGHTAKPFRDTAINPSNSFSSLFFDSAAMEQYLSSLKATDTAKNLFRNFYIQRNYEYAWFDSTGVAEQAVNFWNLQENYIAYSGDSTIFNPYIQRWADSIRANGPRVVPDSARLNIEWQLTIQFFRYADKAYAGNRKLDARSLEWFIPRKKIDYLSVLDTLVKEKGKSISSYEPVNQQYRLLRDQLMKYYGIRANGGWKTLNPSKKKYILGDSLPEIRQIKSRLFMTGDLKTQDTGIVFNKSLELGVKNFQRRYGIKEDGAIGGGTLSEMNKPIDFRIRQILVNMERMRWVPAEPAGDFILVNIPQFKLHVFEEGKPAFNMNVVVGTTQNNTVIFTGKLKYVVFSPYWNVPPSILKKEILPAMKRNPDYLEKNDMEWYGDQLRQRPGPQNPLGYIKFLFPNSYNIYLHDTPSKNLFNETKRTFSHGCIRISDARKLAKWILRDESSWTDPAIDNAMYSGKEKFVTIKKDITVFVGYFTAWVDRDGNLNFRDDIYGHDRRMAEKMFEK
ncbi:L,D-transpeptidase family protein [Flavihumibacter profundi]|uniref:L,D-transpeptidase family protein n=1 Tax=Flavihumibacter profundi TaxID=2716883 RepID=UPI001CC4FEDC|nr:L,D-transpeptidase family protein [Flavihumibacter profundi]MBZ5858221.1 L,D-transpeptidase family protein [Flavihumibacter profundi]